MALDAGRLALAVDAVLADTVIEGPATEEVIRQPHRSEPDGWRPEDRVAVETGPARAEGSADGGHRAGPGRRAADTRAAVAGFAGPAS